MSASNELRDIVDALGLTPARFRALLAERGVGVEPRALRRYLAPQGASTARRPPPSLMVAAREIAGRPLGSEWIVGTDETGRRVVVHTSPPRFAAVVRGRGAIASVEWWDEAADEAEWSEAARRASERFWHRDYRARSRDEVS